MSIITFLKVVLGLILIRSINYCNYIVYNPMGNIRPYG